MPAAPPFFTSGDSLPPPSLARSTVMASTMVATLAPAWSARSNQHSESSGSIHDWCSSCNTVLARCSLQTHVSLVPRALS